jgi:hypothetical protein
VNTLPCTPSDEGTFAISVTATDANGFSVTSGILSFTVSKRADSVTVVCSPSDVDVGKSEKCTVTVKDISPGTISTPTGKITVTILGPGGFSATRTCTLSGSGGTATCHISFTPPATGTYTVTASYPGDFKHVLAAATVTLVAGPSG